MLLEASAIFGNDRSIKFVDSVHGALFVNLRWVGLVYHDPLISFPDPVCDMGMHSR